MNRTIRVSMVWVVLTAVVMSSMVGVSVAEVPPPLEMRGFSAGLSPGGQGWAVWSADNGHDTDVYYSRFTERGWLDARPLHTDPDTWDSFPSLAFAADGTPWVAWSSGEQEQGRLYVSRWVGYRWSRPVQVPLDPASQPQQPTLAAAPDGGFCKL